MNNHMLSKHQFKPLLWTAIAVVVVVAGVFYFSRPERPSTRDAEPRVQIEQSAIPEGWSAYNHASYALAYPAGVTVTYDDTFDVLSFFVSSSTDAVARIFPSRTVDEEVEQLKHIAGSTVNTSDVYADVIKLTRISLRIPNDRGALDLITYFMFYDGLNKKTYTFKMDKNASWAEFNAVAQTIRTP